MSNKFIIKLDDSYLCIDEGCEVEWNRWRTSATIFADKSKEEISKACEVLFDVKVETEDVL